jgi:hypothetical protein
MARAQAEQLRKFSDQQIQAAVTADSFTAPATKHEFLLSLLDCVLRDDDDGVGRLFSASASLKPDINTRASKHDGTLCYGFFQNEPGVKLDKSTFELDPKIAPFVVGDSMLHIAAKCGSTRCIAALLALKADGKAHNCDGKTARLVALDQFTRLEFVAFVK